MATRNLISAVRATLDGDQQRFRFESDDGQPIPHETSDLVVKINGDPLVFREGWSTTQDGDTAIIILLKIHPRGSELSIERHTQLIQDHNFRRQGANSLNNVEKGMDHLTRAVQDGFRRLMDVERIVSVEHRVVEIPANVATPDPSLVTALEQHMSRAGMTAEDKAELSEIIATVVVSEFAGLMEQQAHRVAALERELDNIGANNERRIALLETQMERLAIATREEFA